MGEKITLTKHEKSRLKIAYPSLKSGDWNWALYIIGNDLHDQGYSNSPPHILAFLKENGIDLWHKITEIPSGAFCRCNSLQTITIPNGVTEIGEAAFCWCKALQEITIPDSITKIDWRAFAYCAVLKKIKYDGTQEQWNKINKDEYWNDDSSIKTIKCSDGDIQVNEQ